MNKMLMMVATGALCCCTAFAETAGKTIPLAEARAKIGDVVQDPAKTAEIMSQLSAEDQKAFVADVNEAISKMPGTVEERTAKYLNFNHAALVNATKGNIGPLVAEVFATVPPESLTVLSESFANDLFSRDADPAHPYTDEAFEAIAKSVVSQVVERTAGSDDADVRNTLAILMFTRASKGSPDDLAKNLCQQIQNEEVRAKAVNEWIPDAMKTGSEKSYEAMLAEVGDTSVPADGLTLTIAGPQSIDPVLEDLSLGVPNKSGYSMTPVTDVTVVGVGDIAHGSGGLIETGIKTLPRSIDRDAPYNPNNNAGTVDGAGYREPPPYGF